jgi:hypothetical protein
MYAIFNALKTSKCQAVRRKYCLGTFEKVARLKLKAITFGPSQREAFVQAHDLCTTALPARDRERTGWTAVCLHGERCREQRDRQPQACCRARSPHEQAACTRRQPHAMHS